MLTFFKNSTFTIPRSWSMMGAAGLLVTIPVFIQAPLVRSHPWLSLVFTLGWLSLSRQIRPSWGSLIWGFALTWFCGSLYWGWYRLEPLWHLPIEAVALPLALWGLNQGQYRIGSCFYLGSLWGTIVTDIYFGLNDLFPAWRVLVHLDPDRPEVIPALYGAWLQVQTPWGLGWGVILALSLVWLATAVLTKPSTDRYVFAGAILFTLVTDSLFAGGLFMLISV